MIKQIFNRRPRKPSPKSDADSPAAAEYPFRDVAAADRPNLFLRKLILCSVTYDFTDPTTNLRDKDLKRQTLLELVDYVNTGATKFSDIILDQSTRMIAANLFRTLPSAAAAAAAAGGGDPSDEDPAWPHLQIVHEFLLRILTSPDTDAKIAQRYIDHSFVLRLLDLFDSQDQREREYVKTILHRLYGKFMHHRPFIRKAINNIFYRFIFETEHHNGIAELLEILGSIINGFTLPLKEEHRMFLIRVLLPLHKPKCVPLYYKQLSNCITQFVEKDGKLAGTVIRGLLKYWPVTSFWKEVMFIEELEEVLEDTPEAEFQSCMVPLFKQIGRCLSSSHFQVAERALFLWNNDDVQNLIIQNRKVILPIIFPALERTAKGHWNQAVQSLTLTVMKLFLDADLVLFQECLLRFDEDEEKEKATQEKRETTWKQLEGLAVCNSSSNEALLLARVASSLSLTSPSPRAAAVGT